MSLKKWNKAEWNMAIQCIRPKLIPYSIGVIGNSLTEASIFATIAFVFRDMLNAGVSGDFSLLKRGVWLISIEAIVASILLVVFGYLFNVSVKKAMITLRMQTFDRTIDMRMQSMDKLHSGDLISRMNTDIQTVETIFSVAIPSLVYALIYGISSAVLMIMMSWQVAIIIIALGALLVTVNSLFMKKLRKIGDRIQSHHGDLNTNLVDVLDGYSTVKLFSLEKIMTKKYGEVRDGLWDLTVRRGRFQGILDGINFLLGSLNYVGILVVGSYLVSLGYMNLGDTGAIVQFAMGLTFLFQQLGGILTQLQGSLSGMGRVQELQEMPMEHTAQPKDTIQRNEVNTSGMISCNDLSFTYDAGFEALSHLSFQVRDKEMVAFVGGSGSGKSTLMKLLMKFYEPTEGDLSIHGISLKNASSESLREQIVYVPQDAYLFQGTLAENIRIGRMDASEEELILAAKKANAHDFIMAFEEGYETRIGDNGVQLSGGQNQRIALARAFLSPAPIVLLDEATSALDNTSEQIIQEAVERFMQDRTVVMIAHKLSTVRHADRIYVMENGRIVEEGAHEELLFGNGLYRRMLDRDFAASGT